MSTKSIDPGAVGKINIGWTLIPGREESLGEIIRESGSVTKLL